MKSKFRKGRKIGSFQKLIRELETTKFVIWQPNRRGWWKVMTWGFVQNWSAHLILMFLRQGAWYEAIPRKVRVRAQKGNPATFRKNGGM